MKSAVVCVALLLAGTWGIAESGPIALRIGGGALMTNSSRPGVYASVEIPISEDYPTHIAPFMEYYSRDGMKMIPIGIGIIYKARFTDYGGTIFFGAGGGAMMVRGEPGFGYAKGTNGMIGAVGGLSLGFSDRIGGFAQARWLRSFEDETADNEIGFHVGLQFDFGE